MAAEGKKDVTVKVKMKVTDLMSAAAKKYKIEDPKLEKLISKEFKFEKKVETDPRKNSQRDLDSAMERLLTYAMGLVANGLDELGAKDLDAKKKKKREAEVLADLESIFKDMEKVCEEKLTDILSGKEDNKGAIKKGTQAFAKLDKVDPKGAFDKPRQALIKAFDDLEKQLKGNGDKKAACQKATKDVQDIMKGLEDSGMEVANAAEFMLRAARSIKSDRKADSELVAFAKKVLKYENELGGFEQGVDDFKDLVSQAIKEMSTGDMEADVARSISKELAGMNDLEQDGRAIAGLMKELKPEFDKIVKKLNA